MPGVTETSIAGRDEGVPAAVPAAMSRADLNARTRTS